MKQTLIATTNLGSQVSIGEHAGYTTHAKPGKYNVYAITRDDYDEYAILFAHESETQDIHKLLKKVEIVTFCGVDFASYGIQTIENDEDWSYEKWCGQLNQESNDYKDGFVTNTNCGDGLFTLYINEKHSVFLLDDEDICIQELAAEQGITDFELMRSYIIDEDEVRVEYYRKDENTINSVHATIGKNERNVDVLVQLLKKVQKKVNSKSNESNR